jgi:rhodanese-related sulfurtransferase
MNTISPRALQERIQVSKDFEILDIREPYEYDLCNLGSLHIPMDEVPQRVNELPADKNIAVMCRSGRRAEAVVNMLETDFRMSNVYLLEGGIVAWKEQVDTSLDIES